MENSTVTSWKRVKKADNVLVGSWVYFWSWTLWKALKDPQEDLDHFANCCSRTFSLHDQKGFFHPGSSPWKLLLPHLLPVPSGILPYLARGQNSIWAIREEAGFFNYMVPIAKKKINGKEKRVESEMYLRQGVAECCPSLPGVWGSPECSAKLSLPCKYPILPAALTMCLRNSLDQRPAHFLDSQFTSFFIIMFPFA